MKRGKFIVVIGLLFVCLNAHAQIGNDSITLTTPDSRFTDNGDGTVKDKQTGLIWMRCTLEQTWDGVTCTGGVGTYTWQQALQAADGYSFAGSDAWRVPNIKELESIVERGCSDPSINLNIFPATPSAYPSKYFWTSSSVADYNESAWYANFDYGHNGIGDKLIYGFVRLVRSDSD